MMKSFYFLLFLFVGCAQVTSLNLRKHQFGLHPTKIIWFQVAGLEEEQLAMLRFNRSSQDPTSFERSICYGKTWAYDLYNLRPSSENIFLSQLTGKKNIQNNCEDARLLPIWSFLSGNGFITGVVESGVTPTQSLLKFNQCGEHGLVFLSSLYLWLRQDATGKADTYLYSEKIPTVPNQIFYDKSCGPKSCQSSLQESFRGVYQSFSRNSQKHLFLFRDYTYLKALEAKDFVKAREVLADLERTYAYALNLAQENSDYLVLLTTADSKSLDLPSGGKTWFEFDKSGANAQLKKGRLTNVVLASGSRAENFCGMYENAEIFERILSGPKQQGLELKIINPFK